MKKNYSEPKIFNGGVDVTKWSKLTAREKKVALSKPWYVYFSFRNPSTGKLERQTNIKGDANKYITKKERLAYLKTMQQALLKLLQFGFSPYQDNKDLEKSLFETTITSVETEKKVSQPKENLSKISKDTVNQKTIAQAIEEGMLLRKNMMSEDSFKRYRSRIKLFENWLKEKKYFKNPIDFIDKQMVTQYLNEVLMRSSARNRNNTRTDLASLFQLFQDNEIIKDNFVRLIPKVASKPKRNKTYKPDQVEKLLEYIVQKDPTLLLFIKFISYGFLRPIEVCRLKMEDVDIDNKRLYVKAKNKPSKIKLLPEILLNELPKTDSFESDVNFFGRYAIGEPWDATPNNKRGEFTARFKKIKEHFGLSSDYGLYSFRHTYITKLYQKLRETKTVFEAKSYLMMITGHETMDALNKYLRDIDAELPDDFSSYFE